MPRILHIILLTVYCHFTMAGFAGAWVMKRSVTMEERSTAAVSLTAEAGDDAGASGDEGDGGSESSPCDPDQCHRPVHTLHISLHPDGMMKQAPTGHNSRASLRPSDIQTPPPRS